MDFRVLATRGVGGYRQYRIPALGVTPSGRLLAVYDGRPDLDDLPGPIDLVMRVSDDDGNTWSEQTVLRPARDIRGFGDASIVVDPTVGAHGRIIVFSQATELAGFFESALGCDDDDPGIAHVEISISDDNGVTWSHRRITSQVKADDTAAIFATSGMGGRIAVGEYAGRLLQTFVLRRRGEVLAAVGYSDDHGQTWSLGAEIPGGNESAAVGLADGTVLVHSRAYPHRLSGCSVDGGQTLQTLAPDKALTDPGDNGSLCALPTGDVVCTHNHDGDLRRNTVVKRSHDGGLTWPEAVVIEAGSSAYSTACPLPNGDIGVLFERNGYTEMVFARVTDADFHPAEQVLRPVVDAHGIEREFVLRYVLPARLPLPEAELEQLGRLIPPADTSVWEAFERKEVGHPGATSEPIYTRAELDVLLGQTTPGLHVGDELRFSGRVANHADAALADISVVCDRADFRHSQDVLAAGQRMVFPDLRVLVSAADVAAGELGISFVWRATPAGDSRELAGTEQLRFSTETGLPLR